MPEEREIRIDLPVRAFVPPGWLEQEALRLDLYRRIGSAADHELLARVREESVDRFGRLPEEVETLFAVASLRLTCTRLGVEEISTYRQQVRIKPLELAESLDADLRSRVPEATYHRTTATLNLDPEPLPGAELPAWIERTLVRASSEHDDVATMPS
jgi:transcription-repair coupling factor (superfamily II helicase)